eukprot:1626442-Rhodomonas_salina.3
MRCPVLTYAFPHQSPRARVGEDGAVLLLDRVDAFLLDFATHLENLSQARLCPYAHGIQPSGTYRAYGATRSGARRVPAGCCQHAPEAPPGPRTAARSQTKRTLLHSTSCRLRLRAL